MSSNLVSNHSRDKQIGIPLRSRPILLSLVSLQAELDSTQSYYRYLSQFDNRKTGVTELDFALYNLSASAIDCCMVPAFFLVTCTVMSGKE